MEHVNFYENQKEAMIRLRNTVVLYDSEPYYCFAITNHKDDGVLRIYLQPIEDVQIGGRPEVVDNYPGDWPTMGESIDKWMDQNPNSKIIRKKMDSKYFDKFRPFPLGMCNTEKQCFYLERQPLRPKTEQGLIRQMICETWMTSSANRQPNRGLGNVSMWSPAFRACILGKHPSAAECISGMLDKSNKPREAVAFHRDFCFVRGPIDILFLGYKSDIIGVLPNNNLYTVKLGNEFSHCKEVVQALGVFSNIVVG